MEISVVIPTYHRTKSLEACLKALARQTLDRAQYEVIIADDESSFITRGLVKRFQDVHSGLAWRYVGVRGTHGPAAARNQGWKQAQGRIIAFTDDDCLPEPLWLREVLSAFRHGVDAAWGSIYMPLSMCPTASERNTARLAQARFVTANCFCLKSVLEQVEGFDERFKRAWREDSDLFFTLLKNHKRIIYAPLARVQHPIRQRGLMATLLQEKNNFYEALLFKKHPEFYKKWCSYSCVPFYYTAVLAGVALVVCWLGHWPLGMILGGVVWFFMAAGIFGQRIYQNSKHPQHIFETAMSSLLVPFLSVGWRLAGALHFKTLFV